MFFVVYENFFLIYFRRSLCALAVSWYGTRLSLYMLRMACLLTDQHNLRCGDSHNEEHDFPWVRKDETKKDAERSEWGRCRCWVESGTSCSGRDAHVWCQIYATNHHDIDTQAQTILTLPLSISLCFFCTFGRDVQKYMPETTIGKLEIIT